MTEQSRVGAGGTVTIPQDVREALGLKTGQAIEFARNDRGEVVIRAGQIDPDFQRRYEEALAAIDSVAGTVDFGMSTDEYMALIRGPRDHDE